jgi:predicted ABC-type ATPase
MGLGGTCDRPRESPIVVLKPDKEIATSENQTEQKPVLIILAGSAGAGKATFYEGTLKTVFPTLLKASTSPLEQTETNRERTRLLKAGQPFVYQDATIDSQIIREAQDSGFDVKVFYIGTEDPNLNMGRVLVRVNNGGTFASLARIPDDYAQSMKQLSDVKKVADDLMLFDNTAHGRGHRLVAHFQAGELMKLARSVPKWAQKVFGKEFEKWLGTREHGFSRVR